MPKTYKAFVKEYSMGLQVPSTSYLKGVGSLNPLRKKEDVVPIGQLKPIKQKGKENFPVLWIILA